MQLGLQFRHARAAARRLLHGGGMKTLEARFHPHPASRETYVVVAHVVWDDTAQKVWPRVVPSPSLPQERAPATLLATVRHLVLKTGPTSFDRLTKSRTMRISDTMRSILPIVSPLARAFSTIAAPASAP